MRLSAPTTALIQALAIGSAVAALTARAADAVVLYVDASLSTGGNDGSSWSNAYRGASAVTTALAHSSAGDEIWVKAGSYKPTVTASRTISINLKSGVAIYGGFAGGETKLDERDPAANPTVLTGDLGGNDPVVSDNSYHVIRANATASSAVVDGFTITAGNANGPTAAENDRGGGALLIASGDCTFRNCLFVGNHCTFGGGACHIRQSAPTFLDCTFQQNVGGAFGGAIDIITGANPLFDRCLVTGNSAARAGGMEIFGGSQPTIVNTVFTDNLATGPTGGGGLLIANASAPIIRNCTIAYNLATIIAGGIVSTGSATSLGNCIVWGNSSAGGTTDAANQVTGAGVSAEYSTIQFGFVGTGNSAQDPQFIDPSALDLRLTPGSPSVDAGDNTLVPGGTSTDLDGMPRFADIPEVVDTGAGTSPIVDRGAYEVQPMPSRCPPDLDANGTVDGADLGLLLATWGGVGADIDGDGITDGADLGIMLAGWGACRF